MVHFFLHLLSLILLFLFLALDKNIHIRHFLFTFIFLSVYSVSRNVTTCWPYLQQRYNTGELRSSVAFRI